MIVVSAAEANGEFAPTHPHPVLLERTPVRHPDVYSDGFMLTLLDSRPCRAEKTATNQPVNTQTHHHYIPNHQAGSNHTQKTPSPTPPVWYYTPTPTPIPTPSGPLAAPTPPPTHGGKTGR